MDYSYTYIGKDGSKQILDGTGMPDIHCSGHLAPQAADPSLSFLIARKNGLFTYIFWQKWVQTGPRWDRDAGFTLYRTPGTHGLCLGDI